MADYTFPARNEDIGGRSLPSPEAANVENETFGQAKSEAIGGRSLPKPQEGASTLSYKNVGDVDNLGKFASKS